MAACASTTLWIGRHAQARTRSLASQWSSRQGSGGAAGTNGWRPTPSMTTMYHTSASPSLTAAVSATTSSCCTDPSTLPLWDAAASTHRLGSSAATTAASRTAAVGSSSAASDGDVASLSSLMALCTAASMMMLTTPSATLAEAAPTPMATSSSATISSPSVHVSPLTDAKAHFMTYIKRRGSSRKKTDENDEDGPPPSLLPRWLQYTVTSNNTAAECESQSLQDTESDFLAKGDPYEVSVAAIQGRRETMEDEVLTTGGGRFVAVFDGHGGGDVSRYLRRHIYDLFLLHLERKHWEESDADVQDSQLRTPSIAAYMAALREALNSVEVEVMRHSSLNFVGSTAVAVVLHEIPGGTKTLISANIGDSRAVLSRRGKAVDLTKDHKPTSDSERRRILEAGGRIFLDDTGVHRVMNLSLSRAVGDKFSKPIVSAEPDIRRFRVEEDDDEFIILASDGLWDVMSSQDVVSFVHARLSEARSQMIGLSKEEQAKKWNEVRENMAHLIGAEALIGGSADNTSVVMVWLNDMERPHHSA